MWQRGGLVFLAIVGSFFFITKVKAVDPTLNLVDQEPFVLRYHAHVQPNETYRVKVRFSQDRLHCSPECRGETRSGDIWLKQTESWQSFPSVTADSLGAIEGLVIGRSQGEDSLFIQLAVKKDSGSTVEIVQTWAAIFIHPPHFVQVVPVSEVGSAVLVLKDGSFERLIPILSSVVTVATVEKKFTLQLMDEEGNIRSQSSYFLQGEGNYRFIFPPQALPPYEPLLTVEQSRFFRGEAQNIHLVTQRPYANEVNWYIDNVLQSVHGPDLLARNLATGLHSIKAVLPLTQEISSLQVEVLPYTAVKLESLLPNPIGADSDQEIIRLRNNHDVPAILKGWRLHSRASSRSITIETTIPAGESRDIVGRHRLVNTGGTYDLYDDTNRLIDTVTYPQPKEGDVFMRNGLEWRTPQSAIVSKGSDSLSVTRSEVQGVVVLPRGKTFDLTQLNGLTVHVVIHPSFNGHKPVFHKGDMVRVTGQWRNSKSGRYLSVRLGDTIELVSAKKLPVSTRPSRKRPTLSRHVPSLIAQAQAAEAEPGLTSRPPPRLVSQSDQLVSLSVASPWLNLVFALIITSGLVLLCGSRKTL